MSSFVQVLEGVARAASGADDADGAPVLAAFDGDAASLTDDQLISALRGAESLGRQLDAVRAGLAAEAAERSRRELGGDGLARRLGCRSHVELLQRVTGAAAATVNRRVRLGRAVRPVTGITGVVGPPQFPHVAAALADGLLGVDAATAVVDTLRPTLRVAGAAAVEVAEAAIVGDGSAPSPGAAPALDADSVRLQAQVWASVLDPDGAEPTEADLQRRGLWLLAPRHGLVPLRGNLLPDVAAALRTYVDACTNPRTPEVPAPEVPAHDAPAHDVPAPDPAKPDASAAPSAVPARAVRPVAHASAAPADLPEHLVDVRSRAQQMHDVLTAIVGTAARVADAPSLAGNAPTLVVTVRAEDLAAGTGPALADTTGENGAPLGVGMTAARHTGCTGAVQKLVLDASGRVTGIGSPQRCFTGAQRRAITVRDGGCVIPGCHVPAAWCETHHVTPHAQDPTGTHTDNGVLLCWYHHRSIDTAGWHVRMRAGLPQVRAPRWIDPDGAWRAARGSPHAALARITAVRGTLARGREPAAPDG